MILVMQMLRMKGGRAVYDHQVITKQRRQLSQLLLSIYNDDAKKSVLSNLKAQPELRLSSLFAIAVLAAKGIEQGRKRVLELFGDRNDDDSMQHELGWAVHTCERIESMCDLPNP